MYVTYIYICVHVIHLSVTPIKPDRTLPQWQVVDSGFGTKFSVARTWSSVKTQWGEHRTHVRGGGCLFCERYLFRGVKRKPKAKLPIWREGFQTRHSPILTLIYPAFDCCFVNFPCGVVVAQANKKHVLRVCSISSELTMLFVPPPSKNDTRTKH